MQQAPCLNAPERPLCVFTSARPNTPSCTDGMRDYAASSIRALAGGRITNRVDRGGRHASSHASSGKHDHAGPRCRISSTHFEPLPFTPDDAARRFIPLACRILFPLAASQAQTPDTVRLTRAETLRGFDTPPRSWWDVAFYDVYVRVKPADSSLRGWNGITYRVLHSAPEMQIDLQQPLEVDSSEYAVCVQKWHLMPHAGHAADIGTATPGGQ